MVQSSRFSWTSPAAVLSHKEMGLCKFAGIQTAVGLDIEVSLAFI